MQQERARPSPPCFKRSAKGAESLWKLQTRAPYYNHQKSRLLKMKKNLFVVLGIGAAVLMTSCKSQQSAYRQAWEKAQQAQNAGTQDEQQAGNTQSETVTVTPVTPAQTTTPVTDNSDVRTIDGEMSVIKGSPLKTYSVVVSSFVTQANAEGLQTRLTNEGYDARVVKTNETINGKTGWFRVVASSYDDKASAVQSRTNLRAKFPGAWLLYRK